MRAGLRRFALGSSIASVTAGVLLAGCAPRIDGAPTYNDRDRAAYVTEAKKSAEAVARTEVCDVLDTAADDAQTKLDALKRAIDDKVPSPQVKAAGRAAADAHRDAGAAVDAELRKHSDTPSDVKPELTNYASAASAYAKQLDRLIDGVKDDAAFDRAQDDYFDSRSDARRACP